MFVDTKFPIEKVVAARLFNGKENKWPGRKKGKYQWYEIQDAVDYYEQFEKTKILWPGISGVVTAFAMDSDGYYGNDNNQLVISDSKYLMGIMNSKVSTFFLKMYEMSFRVVYIA